MSDSSSNQGKLSKALKEKSSVVITKKNGDTITGKPTYSDSNGSPDWLIEDEQGHEEPVNLNDIERVDTTELDENLGSSAAYEGESGDLDEL